MGEAKQPMLEVWDSATGDVSPTSAFVHVVLTSDRFFSGRAAFENAEELRRLATLLAARGIAESGIALEGASADVSSGMFSKSSAVTYRVRVLVQSPELLPGVLDAVSETKKASLTNVEWNYDDNAAEEHALLRTAGERAVAKARVLADSVGARLGALQSVREERAHLPGADPAPFGAPVMARARTSVAQELSGLELAPKRRVTVRVSVVFALADG